MKPPAAFGVGLGSPVLASPRQIGRLAGFCRTNLFKRLESSGQAFPLSALEEWSIMPVMGG